ncbi:MAG: PEGA domain-containing protein [Pseudomonadota bacterium]
MGNRRHLLSTLFLLLPLIQGCSGTAFVSSGQAVSVTTEPPGATVYVMGDPVGNTPLEISQRDIFPTVYDQSKQDIYGTILFKKRGCEDLIHPVGMNVGAGIKVKLDCGSQPAMQDKNVQATPLEEPKIPETQTPQKERPQPVSKQPSASARQRLMNLQDLRDNGLISEDEYMSIRQRILDEL